MVVLVKKSEDFRMFKVSDFLYFILTSNVKNSPISKDT